MEHSLLSPISTVPLKSFFSHQDKEEEEIQSIWKNFKTFWNTNISQSQKSKGIHLKVIVKACPPNGKMFKKLSEIFPDNYIYYPESPTRGEWCIDLDLKDINHLHFLKHSIRDIQFLDNVEDSSIQPVQDEFLWNK